MRDTCHTQVASASVPSALSAEAKDVLHEAAKNEEAEANTHEAAGDPKAEPENEHFAGLRDVYGAFFD